MSFKTSAANTTPIDLSEYADLVEASEVIRGINLDNCMLLFVEHPQRGNLILVNTCQEKCCLIPLPTT